MANTLLLKRSAVANAIPTTGNLALGELAINTNDGLLYTKIDSGTPAVIDLTKTQATGDATGNRVGSSGVLNLTLSNTGVLANSYGNATSIPTFTVDAKGRITSATENPISFSTNSISNGTSNVSIPTSNGNIILVAGGTTTGTITSTGANITGYLNVTGSANIGNIGTTGIYTDNLLYANGQPWDFITPAGANTQIQFNDGAGNLGASAAFTFDTASNVLTVGGNANVGNLGATNVVATNLTGTLTTAAQTNITSVGNLTSLTVTGNANVGNVGATGVVATGNISGANIIATDAFIGNITLTGDANVANLSATGNITGANIISNALLSSATLSVTGNANVGNIGGTNAVFTNLNGTLQTASQTNITAVGTLVSLAVTGNASAGNLSTGGSVTATGNGTFGNLSTSGAGGSITGTGNIQGGNLISTGNISTATGNISGAYFIGNGSQLTGVTASSVNAANLTGNTLAAGVIFSSLTTVGTLVDLTVTGNVSTGNVSGTTGTFTNIGGTLTTNAQPNITVVGTLGNLSVTGNATVGNLSATYLVGTLETAAQPNITSVGNLTTLNVTGNATVGNLSATNISGTLTTASQPNITQVGTLANLTVTANINGGNLLSNTLIGTEVAIISTGNLSLQQTGNITVNSSYINNLLDPVQAQDAATKAYVDSVAQGLDPKASVYLASYGNIFTQNSGYTYNNGASGVGATLTGQAVGNLTIDGNVVASGERILIKDEVGAFVNNTTQSAAFNGIYVVTTAGSPSVAYVLTRATDFDNGSPSGEIPSAFTFVEHGTINADTGWVCTTNAPVTVGTTQIVWAQFSGAGQYTAGTGLGLNGTQFFLANTAVSPASYGNASTIPTFTVNQQGQLTAAGSASPIEAPAANLTGTTLNSTVVTSSLTTVGTLGSLSVTGNISAGNVSATLVGGTLTTANQPNITSVGNLLNLEVAGNVTAGNLSGTSIVGTLTTAAQNNITSVGNLTTLNVTGNAAAGNLSTNGNVTAAFYIGNGSALTGVTASSVDAANLTGNTLASGVLFSSLTTVGTLTSLTVTGNVGAGNVSGTTGTFTNIGGTLTTAAQPNITSVGNLSTLNVTGNATVGNLDTTAGNILAGNITAGNVHSDGVVYTQNVFATNTITGQTINATGNITAGNITSNALLSSATLSVTGNANVGNIGGTSAVFTNLTGTLLTNAQPNITSIGTLESLDISGNVTAGNLATSGSGGDLTLTGGNVIGANVVSANTFSASVGITTPTLGVAGNATVGNLGFGTGQITGTGNITAGYYFGNGSQLTDIVASSANAQTLTGTFLAPNVVGSSLTSVGNLTVANVATLTVSTLANITATTNSTSTTSGALIVAGGVGVVGNIYGGDIYKNGVIVLNANDTIDGGSF